MISMASTVAPPAGWNPVEDLTKSAPAASAARFVANDVVDGVADSLLATEQKTQA
jgi:hypothetical protein